MTEPTWPEMALAGKLFAILAEEPTAFLATSDGPRLAALEINKGVIFVTTRDGDRFELVVRKVEP